MSDKNDTTPENDDPLEDVEQLGGDEDIMESLPDEGSPIIETETEYDELAGEYEADEGESSPEDDAPLNMSEAYTDYAADEAYDYAAPADPYADLVDIEAALASVASISDVLAEREAIELAELARQRDAEVARREAESRRVRRAFHSPPQIAMRRGQMASVVPALLLIAVGGYLTFALSAPDVVPISPAFVGLAILDVLIATLIAYWLASGRWSRGVFFFAVLALLVGASVYYSTLAPRNAVFLVPLLLLAGAGALILTGLLSRPADKRLFLPGALLVVAGAVALVVSLGVVPPVLMASAAPLWPVLAVVIALLWLLPVVLKRRG